MVSATGELCKYLYSADGWDIEQPVMQQAYDNAVEEGRVIQ